MRYAVKRIAMLLLTMLIVSFLTFAAFDMISGDPASSMLGTQATEESVAALREKLGLNRPMLIRYGEWLVGFFTGNMGLSFNYQQPVWDLISQKVVVTFWLSILSFLLIIILSIPLGLWSVRHTGGRLAGVCTAVNQLAMAVPSFFTGILLSWVFGIVLHWFQPGNFPGLKINFLKSMQYLLYAAIAIAVPRIAMTVRMLRSTVMEEMQKDYVRTAISRGNDRQNVLWHHVLKNALVPVVTFLAQTMAEIVAGSIVVEQVFAIPGLGRMLVSSISNRDFPVVQAIVVILAFWVVAAGTIADIINQRIDPRLRLGDGV